MMTYQIVLTQMSLMIALSMLSISAYTDYTRRLVLNKLTFPCMGIGLLMCAFVSPFDAGVRLIWMILFFFFGMLKIMGLGDLKLCMALIALRGIMETSYTLLFGVLLLFLYCLMTEPKTTVLVLKDTAMFFFSGKSIQKRSNKTYPFALFLALGYPIAYYICEV